MSKATELTSAVLAVVALGLGLGGTAVTAPHARWTFETADVPQPDAPGIYGATTEIEAEIRGIVSRFAEVGLNLPELHIYVHDTLEACGGNQGLFSKGGDLHRVDICRYSLHVARHELSHSWEHFNVDDRTRHAFMEATGASSWNDHDFPHPSRGIEQAADVIAWGIEDEPVQRFLRSSYEDRAALYELLTGGPSPRTAQWDDPIPPRTPAPGGATVVVVAVQPSAAHS